MNVSPWHTFECGNEPFIAILLLFIWMWLLLFICMLVCAVMVIWSKQRQATCIISTPASEVEAPDNCVTGY